MSNFKTLLPIIGLLMLTSYGQVGIGTTIPDASAVLDIDIKSPSPNRGILIPRIPLTGTTDATTITTPANSLLVYNTLSVSDVTPGFYYWSSAQGQWIRLMDTQSNDWSVTGNTGTSSLSNFIGTTDNVDLVFRTNNLEAMRIQSGGEIAIGATSVTGDNHFEVRTAAANIDGISSYVTGTGGIALYGYSPDYFGVWGTSTNNTGVYGSSNGDEGVRGSTWADEDVTGLLTPGIFGGNYSTGGSSTGLIGLANGATSTVGVRAVAAGTTSYQDATVSSIGLTANSPELGLYAYSENTIGERYAGHFVAEFDNDDNTYNEPRAQLAGFNPDGVGYLGNEVYYGGYFYSGGDVSGSYAYVGSRENTGTVGSPVWVNHKIIGNGTVSTIVQGHQESVTMFAPEAPEVLFMDCGRGELINGEAHVIFDDILSKNIHISEQNPLKAFVQVEGDNNGVYVYEKSTNGFKIKELKDGKSSAKFSWYIIANRKDEVDNLGNKTVYQSLRFPPAPKRLENFGTIKKEIKSDEQKLEEQIQK